MFQTRSAWWKERLKELWFAKFAEKSKRHSTDILIGMLKIVSNCVAKMSFSIFETSPTIQESSLVSISRRGSSLDIFPNKNEEVSSEVYSCLASPKFRKVLVKAEHTNRMTCIKSPGRGSPLSIITRIFCIVWILTSSFPFSKAFRRELMSEGLSDAPSS